jgi:hypothetical protein
MQKAKSKSASRTQHKGTAPFLTFAFCLLPFAFSKGFCLLIFISVILPDDRGGII